jgi:hypothetical protein
MFPAIHVTRPAHLTLLGLAALTIEGGKISRCARLDSMLAIYRVAFYLSQMTVLVILCNEDINR